MKKLKILVLDCNPIIHIGLKSIFKNSVIFEVCAYLDTKNLLIETICEEKIDLIISEIDLNGSSAKDILRILKKNKIDIPVVIFTSLSNEIKSLKLLKKGASGFLTKNLKKKTIRHILQEIAFSRYNSGELNKFTRLKNRFNFDYNTEKINSLSKRELQVLKLFFRGKRNIEISEKLKINQKTVNTYITRIMRKLEVNSKTDLFILARKHIKQPY
ncbi:MAG: response regulator transcription factor [Flavobacteriaceae bacterium]|nr:response regulator transcription factor [Flavobacteriaceae bacterium]MBL6678395.1 response regulator transcription factor [Flavobacteriaceae bacterium]